MPYYYINRSLFDDVENFAEFSFGDDLMPHYYPKNRRTRQIDEEINLFGSMEEEEAFKKRERELTRKKLDLRAENYTNGVDYFKDFKYIEISLLISEQKGWNYFDKPKKHQFLNLMSSIESIGIFNPLIVMPTEDGKFVILCGESRAKALYNLHKKTGEERFKYAPCFIIDDVEEYFVRTLMIDSNLTYRTISQEVYIKAIFERHELLQRTKTYKNEINVAEVLAEEFDTSTATIYNYLTLKKLCKEALTLIYEKSLKLKSGRLLARLNPEDQLYVLENVSLEDLNTPHRIKCITAEEKISRRELDQRIRLAKDMMPYSTRIQIDISPEMLNKFLNKVVDFKRTEIPKLSSDYAKEHNQKYFKIKLNKEHMEFYREKNIVNEELLDKVYTRKLEEIVRA